MATPFPFQSAAVLTSAQMNAITTLPISTKTASYVALVGDVGSRIVMNVGTANTVTINNSIFAEGDTIFIANKGAGTTTITAGAGVTINGTLTVAQHGGGTLVALSASVFTFFLTGSSGAAYGVATGGSSSSITISSVNYTLLTFTSSGTLTVTTPGVFDCYVVGAGGGGGRANLGGGGGGGAGGILYGQVSLSANQTVTIGAGGTGGVSTSGTQSALGFYVAGGGGSGGHSSAAAAGASGGGANDNFPTGGTTTFGGQGFAGGTDGTGGNPSGGGGGGFASVGANGTSTKGGAGGTGFDLGQFTANAGASTFYAGGGGGGGAYSAAGGASAGGSSVGGDGSGGTGPSATTPTANRGGGGGGGSFDGATYTATNGASGVVMVRFKV